MVVLEYCVSDDGLSAFISCVCVPLDSVSIDHALVSWLNNCQEARHEVMNRMREEMGSKQLDVERSRGQFEQQESLVEQLRRVLTEEKSVQQLMEDELSRVQGEHSASLGQVKAELDLERREREAKEELLGHARTEVERQGKSLATTKEELGVQIRKMKAAADEVELLRTELAHHEQVTADEKSRRQIAESKGADQLQQLQDSLLAQQGMLQGQEQESHRGVLLQDDCNRLIGELQQAHAATNEEKVKVQEEQALRSAAEKQCADQLQQLQASLSQHHELMHDAEHDAQQFAQACTDAAATKQALEAERMHTASLQEDIDRLASELTFEEAALVKETTKREAAEAKWEEEWCDKVAAREASELLQSELNILSHQHKGAQTQCEKLSIEHRNALADLLEVQAVAKHLAACEGTDTENARLHLMLKTTENEMEGLRAQIATLKESHHVAHRSQKASTLSQPVNR